MTQRRIASMILIAALVAWALAPLAGAHVPPGPNGAPQDCEDYDDNGDGAGYWHDYRMLSTIALGQDIFPITIFTDPPGATHGNGEKDNVGVTYIAETNLGECPPGSKKETYNPDQYLGPDHFDGEWDFGYGGAFLSSKHHSGEVCIDDVTFGPNAEYQITSDTDDDGFVDLIQDKATDCAEITIPAGWGPPSKNIEKHCEYNDPKGPYIDFCGLQRGWWIFVQFGTAGHIWTTDCYSSSSVACNEDFGIGKEVYRWYIMAQIRALVHPTP